jgi:hypothetical protein
MRNQKLGNPSFSQKSTKKKVDSKGKLKYLKILGKLIAPGFVSKRERNL